LAHLDYSECEGNEDVRPRIRELIKTEDTTYIEIYASANCNGFYDPAVYLWNDSVLFDLKSGRIEERKVLKYVIQGDTVRKNTFKTAPKYKNSTPTDTIVKTEKLISKAKCNCCYTFHLKLIGLKSNCDYPYFYKDEKLITEEEYQAILRISIGYRIEYFFHSDKESISEGLLMALTNADDLDSIKTKEPGFYFELTVDTTTFQIDSIVALFNKQYPADVEFELKKYLYSLSPIICQKHPLYNRYIRKYVIKFGMNEERTKVYWGYESGEF
jgi:hypothetical protein